MIPSSTISSQDMDSLTGLLSKKVMARPDMLMSFVESTPFVADILRSAYRPSVRLVSAGHVTPDIAVAADRADVSLVEVIGQSPFTGDIDKVIAAVQSPDDIIYIANPNRVTGTTYSLAELERLAAAVPKGLLIVDECYYDHFGITVVPLIDGHTNVVAMRSFTASFGITSADTGFIVASPERIKRLQTSAPVENMSLTIRKTVLATLMNDQALANHLQEVHDESLRLSTELNRLGVQCRITAADFLLLRVKDPMSVGNELASRRIQIENLDGYPQLENYVKYRIQSFLSNEHMLETFRKMPTELFRLKSFDLRAQALRLSRHAVKEEKPHDLAASVEDMIKKAPVSRKPRKVKTPKRQAVKALAK
jgi:histidinol-phosphate/aromatic aminotransferase/cobyric acid decarboxylase-like protein